MSSIAVFGLGSMGYGIAQSILRDGYRTWGVDVVPAQVERFIAEGGEAMPVTDALGRIDIAVIVVLNAAQTESVLFGEAGIVASMHPGACVIACATVPPDFAREVLPLWHAGNHEGLQDACARQPSNSSR